MCAGLHEWIKQIRIYRNLPINRPWALEITGQKTGMGVYTDKPFVRITYTRTIGSSKNEGGRLHGDGRLLGREDGKRVDGKKLTLHKTIISNASSKSHMCT